MKIDVAVKFIIVLLVIMIISLGAALIIMNSDRGGSEETTPKTTTTVSDTTDPDVTTTPNATTTPEATTTPSATTTPAVTTKPAETTKPSETTTPNVTTAPDVDDDPELSGNILLEKSFRSNTGVSINLRANATAFEQDGKVYLRVDVYLEHYSLSIKSRSDNVLVIDGVEYKFSTNAISQTENVKSETLLYSKTVEIEHGDTISVEATFNSKLTYKQIEFKTITAEGTVTVE